MMQKMRPREHILARNLVAGDWTFYDGFRCATGVMPILTVSGRGKNRTETLTSVRIMRGDGTTDDVMADQLILVRRAAS